MTTTTHSIDIPATPAAVWAVVTDLAALPDWDSGVLEITGTAEVGSTIRLRSVVDPKRTFRLRVSEMSAPHRMVWAGGMPLGLFRGVRTYAIEPTAAGTRFTMTETTSGPLARLIDRSIPDLTPSFEQYCRGLAAEVARRHG